MTTEKKITLVWLHQIYTLSVCIVYGIEQIHTHTYIYPIYRERERALMNVFVLQTQHEILPVLKLAKIDT